MSTVAEQRADTPVCESLGSPVTPAITPVSGKSVLLNSLHIFTTFLFLLCVFEGL